MSMITTSTSRLSSSALNDSSTSRTSTRAQPSTKKIPTWTTLSSGAVSGLASCLLLQPIDLLKTRMQQQHSAVHLSSKGKKTRTARLVFTFQKVWKDDGVKGFWRGTVPTVVRNVPGVAIYFYSVSELRSIVSAAQVPLLSIPVKSNEATLRSQSSASTLSKLSTTGNLLTGAVARTAVGFVLSPITIVKTRFETSGLRGLFQGFSATALRDAPYAGIYLAVYEKSKTSLGNFISKRQESKRLDLISKNLGLDLDQVMDDQRGGTLVVSMSGLIAGATSTLLTHPFDILKTRMQIQDHDHSNTLSSNHSKPKATPSSKFSAPSLGSTYARSARPALISTFNHVMQTDGSKAFLDGLGLRCARKALSGCIGWSIFEGGRGWWVKNERERSRLRDELDSNSASNTIRNGSVIQGDGVERRI